MKLPDRFVLEMQEIWLQNDPPGTWDQFLLAHDQQSASGLRANTLKISPEQLKEEHPDWNLTPVPWASSGFYFDAELSPGQKPEYLAGLYYIQEPSAMLPAEVLDVQSGDKVLDLCAAPGGKSTRLAELVGQTGLLWANEISDERVKALLRNVELMGIDRAIISNETPERLAAQLPEYFDRILVDAPCSGSGMFRRDASAIGSWEKYGTATCVVLQKDILEAADQMLKPDGYLVYSTCSFSVAEDELMVESFMNRHPEYKLIPYARPSTVSDGLSITPETVAAGRIWPHVTQGDGHFCALLKKGGCSEFLPDAGSDAAMLRDPRFEIFKKWLQNTLSEAGLTKIAQREGLAYYRIHQDHLHLVPRIAENLPGLRYVKTGLYLGSFRQLKNGSWLFEPGHALILTLKSTDFRYALQLNRDDTSLKKYLRGETINWPSESWPEQDWPASSWVAVCLQNHPLGWAKSGDTGLLKNLYPAGWRKSG